VRRRLSWAGVFVGLALAGGLSLWLVVDLDRRATGSSSGYLGEAGHRPPPPRLEIPKIGVYAHVVDLGLQRDGSLEVPKHYGEVGWWKGGPEPGQRGAAVIAGHVDTPTAPAVFFRLRKLRQGDQVRWIGENGVIATFRVTRSEHDPKASFPTSRVYGATRRPELRLITCAGPPDASGRRALDNLIVFLRKG
jgi:sortase (surface protein transpeptidase)